LACSNTGSSPNGAPTVALESDLDLIRLLDILGYDKAWIGEHHSTGWENIGSPEVFIAAAAQGTRHIRLGTGVIQLGLHNPLVLLDRMILLDHLTRGRAMFGIGVGGGLPSDLKVFGLDRAKAGERFEQSIGTILRLLSSDKPIDEKTDWFELHNAALQLQPYSKPHMRVAVASTDPRNLEPMGRLGGQVLTGPIPERVPEMVKHLKRGVKRGRPRRFIPADNALRSSSTRARSIESATRLAPATPTSSPCCPTISPSHS